MRTARTTLKESIARAHAFDISGLNEQLAVAHREIDAIAAATAASVIDR
jgi:hypothetical protein